jgi:predicted dithiol-disulfide oxidoreductase (DUF899 family)
MATAPAVTPNHKVVSHSDWLAARKEFLAKEKELTRMRDEIARQRQQLPWEKVEKNYVFDSPSGQVTLADLFGDKSQLIIYHFMFAPDWAEGCRGCSFVSDHVAARCRTSPRATSRTSPFPALRSRSSKSSKSG